MLKNRWCTVLTAAAALTGAVVTAHCAQHFDWDGDGECDLLFVDSKRTDSFVLRMNASTQPDEILERFSTLEFFALAGKNLTFVCAKDFGSGSERDFLWRDAKTGALVVQRNEDQTGGNEPDVFDMRPKLTAPLDKNFVLHGPCEIFNDVTLIYKHKTTRVLLLREVGNGDVAIDHFGGFVSNAGDVILLCCDFNDDGDDDLLIRLADGLGTLQIRLFDQNSERFDTIAPSTLTPPAGVVGNGVAWKALCCGEFTDDANDGPNVRNDILWFNPANNDIRVWRMTGNATTASVLGEHDLGSVPAGFIVEACCDFDGDGQTDILLRQPGTSNLRIWYEIDADNGGVTSDVLVSALTASEQIKIAANYLLLAPDTEEKKGKK